MDALYSLSKQVKDLSDKYHGNNHQRFPEIYKRCADIFRNHSAEFCGSTGSPILHCKDSSAIVDCYIKSARFYKKNNDTTSEGYTDAIYQLADVYDQLRKSSLALPLRQEYVEIIRKRKGDSSDMTADAFMFMGFTYELLNEFSLANNCYQKELEIREGLNKGDIQIVRERVSDFQKKHNLR
jgi:tetratricopeptide (TPR) repeat protein